MTPPGFRGTLRLEEPLAPYTTWRIGGPAEILAVPRDRDDLILAVRWAREQGLPWRVLGNGSNLLVPDAGVRGLVLHLRKVLDDVAWDGTRVRAGAGVLLPVLAHLAARRGLAGLEFGAGIPGTLGGALVMNAGWHQWEIGPSVEDVTWLSPEGGMRVLDNEACAFRYRGSFFREHGGILVEAALTLTADDDPPSLLARVESFAASRKANQPTELPSCGSVFLKPEGDFAGRLIEAAGLKGYRVGGIEVSPKHANFFVNVGGGTAADVLALVEHVERVVLERLGVRLTREFVEW
ncbi:MAG TPA: UDP-N-acetylmuramate dehydrogenase [Candidatus Polarisedimenticolaceae bacterium]|nr:UDP-N-acetylmuramate dehydrogenase [Candidatus Polarisedimenticolaceae bacterium]